MNYQELNHLVKSRLSQKRYQHTLAVVRLSEELAKRYDVSVENARIAAILHDITKEQGNEAQLQIIRESDIIMNTVYENTHNLYHGLTAYLYARDVLQIDNTDILNAIRYHTTARANMSILEKIIYVSDATSYDRSYKEVESLRKLSFEDIDTCMVKIIEFIIKDLLNRKSLIAGETIECYNFMVQKRGMVYEN